MDISKIMYDLNEQQKEMTFREGYFGGFMFATVCWLAVIFIFFL